jgi:glycosyltransferase involved in cell wall biosynthesis
VALKIRTMLALRLPRISIATTVFNGAATVGRAAASIDSQTLPPFEHLVQDGGSSDGTLAAIPHAHWRSVESAADQGIYDGMNRACARASGDVLGILGDDDVLAGPRVLEAVAQAFARTGCDLLYGDVVYRDPSTGRPIRWWRSGQPRRGSLALGWIPPHPATFVRLGLWQRYGPYRLSHRLAADHEFLARCCADPQVRIAYLPATLVHMDLGGATSSGIGNVLRQNGEILRGLRRLGRGPSPLFPLCKVLERARQRVRSYRL